MDTDAFRTGLPPSARLAFEDTISSSAGGGGSAGAHFSAEALRQRIAERAAGRWTTYRATLTDPPFVFPAKLVLAKIRELRADLVRATTAAPAGVSGAGGEAALSGVGVAGTGPKTAVAVAKAGGAGGAGVTEPSAGKTPAVAKAVGGSSVVTVVATPQRVALMKYELMRWWLLLKEHLDMRAQQASASLAGAGRVGAGAAGAASLSSTGDVDLLVESETCVADPFFQALAAPSAPDLSSGAVGSGGAGEYTPPTIGNPNVSAHGVRLDVSAVGAQVAACMRGLVDAYFPQASGAASAPHSHFLERALQEAYVESFAHPLAGAARVALVDTLFTLLAAPRSPAACSAAAAVAAVASSSASSVGGNSGASGGTGGASGASGGSIDGGGGVGGAKGDPRRGIDITAMQLAAAGWSGDNVAGRGLGWWDGPRPIMGGGMKVKVVWLEAEPSHGATTVLAALLSRFVFPDTHNSVDAVAGGDGGGGGGSGIEDVGTAGEDAGRRIRRMCGARMVAYYLAAPQSSADDAFRYLATELAVQLHGKAGLEDRTVIGNGDRHGPGGPPGGAGSGQGGGESSSRQRFVQSLRGVVDWLSASPPPPWLMAAAIGTEPAAASSAKVQTVVIVVDGLSDPDQELLLSAVCRAVEGAGGRSRAATPDISPPLPTAATQGTAAASHVMVTCVLSCNHAPDAPPTASGGSDVGGGGESVGGLSRPGSATGGSGRAGVERHVAHMPALDATERRAVCRAWMRQFGKENAAESQLDIAARPNRSGLPMYLALFCLEASVLGLFEGVDYELQRMPDEARLLWRDRTLPRLEGVFGAPLVRAVMRQLLAHPRGIAADSLLALCARDPALTGGSEPSTGGGKSSGPNGASKTSKPESAHPQAQASGAATGGGGAGAWGGRKGLAQRLAQLVDALPPMLRRPGPVRPSRDLILLNSKPLVQGTKERYAPVLLRREQVMAELARRNLQDVVTWRRQHGAIVEQPVAPFEKPPPPPAKAPETPAGPPQIWRFDADSTHRDIRVGRSESAVKATKTGGGGAARTAVVEPPIPVDGEWYLEVRVEPSVAGAGADGGVRVGFMYATDLSLRRVRESGVAAGSLREGFLFACGDGSLVTDGVGYDFAKEACCGRGDCVGVLVAPARRAASLYVNGARVADFPIHKASGGAGLDWGRLRFVVDISATGQAVTIVPRPCPTRPTA